jgi:crossover junction endodeoxyribonuclease ruvC
MPIQASERCVLGIDPGTRYMGYALIHGTEGQTPSFTLADVVVLTKIRDPYARLARIHEVVVSLIQSYHVTELAIEAPFYGKNAQSMLKLGRAQGVALAASLSLGVPAVEYPPRRVKEVITSNGQASKGQVARMLSHVFPDAPLATLPSYDATDALSIALCHFYVGGKSTPVQEATRKLKTSSGRKSKTNWGDYIASNPEKIVSKPHLSARRATSVKKD